MHSLHGDIHDMGLQDGCAECEYHAKDPFRSLDREMLAKLVVLTLEMRMNRESIAFPRTENEAIARANVMNTLERFGRIVEAMVAADRIEDLKAYYRQCWRIEF